MSYLCRMYRRSGTERSIDAPFLDVPNEYVYRNVQNHRGAVTYVEVLVRGFWLLFRVEALCKCVFVCDQATPADFDREYPTN